MNLNVQSFEHKCRQAGLKVTPQRIAVYKVLKESVEHPSAEAVLQRVKKLVPNVSLDTVNRTLLTFSRIGIASEVPGSGGAKRFDANLKIHQHFKCIKCKKIVDCHCKSFDNIKVPRSLTRKFKVLTKTVYFEGICDSCLHNLA
ncbi:MAG: Fur family transcriptional regulator [Planctomycetota bacterium]|jgi:Fur family peroxide stress response transcriptional regulator